MKGEREASVPEKNMKSIGICQNTKMNPHPFFWTSKFIELCEKENFPYVILDPYANGFIEKALNCSAVIWHYSLGIHADSMEASSLLSIIEECGIPVFPNWKSRWYNNEKIAESEFLKAINAPTPKFWVFYSREECDRWIDTKAEFPIVAKLRVGAGSNNVTLLKNKQEAKEYSKRMFSTGIGTTNKLMYKVYSKVQSTHDLSTLFKRVKQVPTYLKKRAASKRLPSESDYCYFQEYVKNDGFDLKIAVVGDKVSYICRKIRKGDFRASGGGDCFYDRSLVSEETIKSAFETADKLGSQSMGFDYVVDTDTKKPYIIEMCYGYDWEVLAQAGGYWDRNLVWHEEPLIAPKEVLYQLIRRT